MALVKTQNHKKTTIEKPSSPFKVKDFKVPKHRVSFNLQGLEKHEKTQEIIETSLHREHFSKPQRRPSSQSLRPELNTKGAKESEKFDYEVISVKDLPLDNEEDDGNSRKNSSKNRETPVESLGLSRRKFTLSVELAEKDLSSSRDVLLPRFKLKTNSRYCSRAMFLGSSEVPKHFCDILGPGMCCDCSKARKQQASVDDFLHSFPEISVSPYMLCVPCDNHRKPTTPPEVYRDCDIFRKRSTSRISCYDTLQSSPTRPNSSCYGEYTSTISPLPYPSPTNYTHGSPLRRQNTWSSFSSVPSSRRSSIARYIDSKNEEIRRLRAYSWSEAGNESVDFQETRSVKSVTITKSAKNRDTGIQSPELRQNVFHKAISARTKGSKSSRGTAIERRGKLNELPYWKFLIPEPPVMEVGRMNVSIYTPKDIPGIKIFDESLFDISVMS